MALIWIILWTIEAKTTIFAWQFFLGRYLKDCNHWWLKTVQLWKRMAQWSHRTVAIWSFSTLAVAPPTSPLLKTVSISFARSATLQECAYRPWRSLFPIGWWDRVEQGLGKFFCAGINGHVLFLHDAGACWPQKFIQVVIQVLSFGLLFKKQYQWFAVIELPFIMERCGNCSKNAARKRFVGGRRPASSVQ